MSPRLALLFPLPPPGPHFFSRLVSPLLLQFDHDNGVGSRVDRFKIDLYTPGGNSGGDCGTWVTNLCDKEAIGCKDSSKLLRLGTAILEPALHVFSLQHRSIEVYMLHTYIHITRIELLVRAPQPRGYASCCTRGRSRSVACTPLPVSLPLFSRLCRQPRGRVPSALHRERDHPLQIKNSPLPQPTPNAVIV